MTSYLTYRTSYLTFQVSHFCAMASLARSRKRQLHKSARDGYFKSIRTFAYAMTL